MFCIIHLFLISTNCVLRHFWFIFVRCFIQKVYLIFCLFVVDDSICAFIFLVFFLSTITLFYYYLIIPFRIISFLIIHIRSSLSFTQFSWQGDDPTRQYLFRHIYFCSSFQEYWYETKFIPRNDNLFPKFILKHLVYLTFMWRIFVHVFDPTFNVGSNDIWNSMLASM